MNTIPPARNVGRYFREYLKCWGFSSWDPWKGAPWTRCKNNPGPMCKVRAPNTSRRSRACLGAIVNDG
jgi:hypothetical protein